MPEITHVGSRRQIAGLSRRAVEAEKAGAWADGIRALRQMLAHPWAHHLVWAADVWDDLHRLHRGAGEYDAAIEAKRAAIAAGYHSEPDPEADIAECHLLAGRLFAILRERTPDDPWLYNAVGFSYAGAGDYLEVERWVSEGIEAAIRTQDPGYVMPQLVDALDVCLQALGREPDAALHQRVDALLAAWKPTSRRRPWRDLDDEDDEGEEEERGCAHCGFDPARSHDELEELEELRRRAIERGLEHEAPETLAQLRAIPFHGDEPEPLRLPRAAPLSFAWFPASEWPLAVERWPDLLDGLSAGHQEYSRALEGRIKAISHALAGHQFHVSPMTVAGLEDFCAEDDLDPGSGEARSSYAIEVLASGGALRWPPGRNEACWCGSAAKYKRCRGPAPRDPDYWT